MEWITVTSPHRMESKPALAALTVGALLRAPDCIHSHLSCTYWWLPTADTCNALPGPFLVAGACITMYGQMAMPGVKAPGSACQQRRWGVGGWIAQLSYSPGGTSEMCSVLSLRVLLGHTAISGSLMLPALPPFLTCVLCFYSLTGVFWNHLLNRYLT